MSGLLKLPVEHGGRGLVVDRDPASRRELALALYALGVGAIVSAADAYTALRLTQARAAWTFVVINLDAPGLNGFELYDRLRDAVGEPLPVIFLTAHPGGRSVEVAEGLPPARLWRRPITAAGLELALRDAGVAVGG